MLVRLKARNERLKRRGTGAGFGTPLWSGVTAWVISVCATRVVLSRGHRQLASAGVKSPRQAGQATRALLGLSTGLPVRFSKTNGSSPSAGACTSGAVGIMHQYGCTRWRCMTELLERHARHRCGLGQTKLPSPSNPEDAQSGESEDKGVAGVWAKALESHQ